jgi:hypothetical protein
VPRAVAYTLVFVSVVGAAVPARAQGGLFAGMQRSLELVTSATTTRTTLASGQTTTAETNSLVPAVRLNMDTLLYPHLRLNAGGVFELSRLVTTVNGTPADSTIMRNRPFFMLRSTSPLLSPGFGYFRREERARTAELSGAKLVNDEYAGYLGWNPAGGPRSDFQYLRTHTFDGSRSRQDVVRDFGSLVSQYEYRNFGAYYRGAYLKTDDRLRGYRTRQLTNAVRVNQSGAAIMKRLVWNSSYNVTRQDLRTANDDTGGELVVPATPFAGLASTSDTPLTARLGQNAALIDGNLTAGAGVDLGLTVPPEDTQARNIGLDFVNPTEVSRLWIWTDRDLPFETANAFSWEVFTSADNLVWRRETLVSAAAFGPFERRFEVDFPAVNARYVKVVVRPLPPAVPDAGRFTDIFVTEVQAFSRRQAGALRDRFAQTAHLVNADVRMRLLDAPSLFYEGFYFYTGTSGLGARTTTLSNGISATHSFARILSAYGRVAREQGTEPLGDRVATVGNATFTVEPIPAFRSSVLYSGQDERVGGVPRSRQALFLQNTAQVYRGVDVLFGAGVSTTTRETGETSDDRLVNVSATVIPRDRVSLTFSYDDRATHRSGTFAGEPRVRTRRLYATVVLDPIRTLHLVIGHERLGITGQRTRTTLDLLANWSPFPDGALQFVFARNEALRALEFGKDGSTLGAVRWNVSRRSYVDVSYQRTRSEFVHLTTESRVFGLSLRLFV